MKFKIEFYNGIHYDISDKIFDDEQEQLLGETTLYNIETQLNKILLQIQSDMCLFMTVKNVNENHFFNTIIKNNILNILENANWIVSEYDIQDGIILINAKYCCDSDDCEYVMDYTI